ncbi:hypothetical protein [Anditalea andensis]|uniref:PepSY domain-containing protein n=1 Tax=Anditalea andensis TaxID=1048983 RepID=A0A074L4H0_9BACT|nr:hypothetical protein [Anditalea andensis]KEO75390.1 hypothetical protein EL17_01475 [Anditalea andensis]
MKYWILIFFFNLILGVSAIAQQDTISRIQQVTRIAPQLLPQSIRDAIENDHNDKQAELTSAEEISQNGQLLYRVNFIKDDEPYSITYDINGQNINKKKILPLWSSYH